jgi:hypothetical protein
LKATTKKEDFFGAIPFFITANLYKNCETRQIFAVFNDSDKEYNFTAYGKTEKIRPYGIAVIEI